MENNLTGSPDTKGQSKVNSNGGINPTFDFSRLSSDDIIADIDRLKKQGMEALKKQSNSFPLDVFPRSIQEIITATNRDLNYPVDFIGASMLFASSVAIGNTYRAQIKNGWLESPVIYLAIVGHAGTNKSHPLSFALQPILEQDKRTYRQYEECRLEYEKTLRLSKKEREDKAIEEPVKPIWKKSLLSDFTPEALVEVHKFNKRGIGVYIDELAGWFKNFNRYNTGSEMEFWLSAWSAKQINIDRKTGDPVFIPMPFISVAGTIQNGILNELAKDNRTQNGFIDRILFVIPDDIQKSYWTESELDPIIIKNWERIISNLLTLSFTNDKTLNPIPKILEFTMDARSLLFEWQKRNTNQSNDTEDAGLKGIYSKMEMYAIRLSLILEMMKFACDESNLHSVGIEAVQGSLKLVEYFKNSAIKVHSIISNSNPLEKYPIVKQSLYKALPETFTTEQGLMIAADRGVPERTFKRFIKEQELFQWLSQGEYAKLI